MDPIVVHKYGGSSLADLDKIRAVAQRIVETVRSGRRVCAVVSAMGGTTDDLLTKAKELTTTPNARELDMLLSTGERVSTSLLAIAVNDLGVPAVSFTGSQSGIITNTRHNRARIIEVRPYRLLDELDAGKVIIVAGYQGVSYTREITTLGRGGTDTTAVALAAALDAEHCEICSDVDGVYTADPRVVVDAKRLASLGHDEMIALARSGSCVLNQDCVEYASQAGVAIFAKATFGPRDDKGSVVRKNPAGDRGAVTAIAHRKMVAVVQRGQGADLSRVIEELERAGAFPSAVDGDTITIPLDDAHRIDALRGRLERAFGEDARLDLSAGTVTVVGPGLGEEPAILREMLSTGREVAGDVRLSLGPLTATLTVASDAVEPLVQRLHAALLG